MEPVINQLAPLLVEQMREQVNNLMAAVQLLTPTIQEQGDRRCDQYLAILNQSTYRLLRTMGDVEYVQAMEQGTLVLRREILDVAGLCQDLADQVADLARQAGVTFRYETEFRSLLLTGDKDVLGKMLLHLISNALAAAKDRVDGEVGLRLSGTRERAVITVWDNGTGSTLPSSEPGGGADPLVRPDGLKLGVLIARQAAALHGGALVFERTGERGVRAVVSLEAGAKEDGTLHTPHMGYNASGGFSPVLVALSNVLPFTAYLPEDVD